MLYIFTALRCEATSFINKFDLKKEKISSFSIYGNEKIRLVITNPGKVNMAMAVSFMAGLYGFDSNDYLLNIGVCAGPKIGELYWINKVTDKDTSISFYPDMIYKTGINENKLTTYSYVAEKTEDGLIDMEGSGFMKASLNFVCPHQTLIFKIVSDMGSPDVTPGEVTSLIDSRMDKISGVIDSLLSLNETEIFNVSEEIYQDFKCTEYMRSDLYKLLKYARNSGQEMVFSEFIEELKLNDKYPSKSKKEGKEAICELKKRLI